MDCEIVLSSYDRQNNNSIDTYRYMNMCVSEINEESTCTMELLKTTTDIRLYLFISNINATQETLVYKIIKDYSSYLNIPHQSCSIAVNKHSTNSSGYKYHVVFPYRTSINTMNGIITEFVNIYSVYNDYVDKNVYVPNMTIKLPNNYKGINVNNKYEIITGSLESMIIQNNINLPELNVYHIQDALNGDVISANSNRFKTIYETTNNQVKPDKQPIDLLQSVKTIVKDKNRQPELIIDSLIESYLK